MESVAIVNAHGLKIRVSRFTLYCSTEVPTHSVGTRFFPMCKEDISPEQTWSEPSQSLVTEPVLTIIRE